MGIVSSLMIGSRAIAEATGFDPREVVAMVRSGPVTATPSPGWSTTVLPSRSAGPGSSDPPKQSADGPGPGSPLNLGSCADLSRRPLST